MVSYLQDFPYAEEPLMSSQSEWELAGEAIDCEKHYCANSVGLHKPGG